MLFEFEPFYGSATSRFNYIVWDFNPECYNGHRFCSSVQFLLTLCRFKGVPDLSVYAFLLIS